MFGMKKEEGDPTDSDIMVFQAHSKPDRLDHLLKTTNYSKKELKQIYQGFKQDCPSGFCSELEFVDIFIKFFPQGDATKYAKLVFSTLKPNCTEQGNFISFDQFIRVLSLLSRGTTKEKIEWIFSLYDIDHDGYISKNEMLLITAAIYEMLGDSTIPRHEIRTPKDHVNKFFHLIDVDKDGLISFAEFTAWCLNDEGRLKGLGNFDTVF